MTLPANWTDGGTAYHASNQNLLEGAVNALYARQGNTHSIFDYGAKVDGQRRGGATISSGSLNQVSCLGYNFTTADVGKTIIIGGNSTTVPGSVANQPHVTIIASISGNNAVLATPATHAVSSVAVSWGTDDGAAWAAALTAVVNGHASQLTMPAGISICGQTITLAPTVSVQMFSLRGSSVASSQIISTATGGFLALDLTGASNGGQTSIIDFGDLKLVAARAGNTNALSVTATQGGNLHTRAYTAENITCSGFDPYCGYWDRPIEAKGLFLPLLQNVFVAGIYSPGTDWSDTSPSFLPTLGINLDGSFAPELAHCQVQNCGRAMQAISTVSNSPQGTFIDTCLFVANREGMYWAGPGGPPQITIHGGHFNNRDANIIINGWAHVIISHQLCYIVGLLHSWSPSSTLATAVNTGATPTTLTLASTAGFPEVGAVQIGSEWFTYSNITTGQGVGSGMNGTTLNNVTRAQFGTADPGSNYAIGTTVTPAAVDILLIGASVARIDNEIFGQPSNPTRINVLLHSGNRNCSVQNTYADTGGIEVAVGNDSTNTLVLHNTCASGTTPVIGSATTLSVTPTPPTISPSYDSSAVSSHQSSVASGTPMTMSYTAAANAAVIVTLFGNTASSGPLNGDTAVVTFGGQTLTSKGYIYENNGSPVSWQWVFALNPQPGGGGAQTISATVNGHTFSGYILAESFTNVTTIGPLQTSYGNSISPLLRATAQFTQDVLWSSITYNTAATSSGGLSFTQRQTGPGFIMGDTTNVNGQAFVTQTLSSATTWGLAALDIQ